MKLYCQSFINTGVQIQVYPATPAAIEKKAAGKSSPEIVSSDDIKLVN